MWSKPIDLNRTWWQHNHWDSVANTETDLFGVELEIEGQKITVPNSNDKFYTLWKRKEDNSLRKNKPGDEAWEYYFREPHNMKHTDKAIQLLEEYFSQKNVVIYDSGRTSIHVHVNFLNETMATIYNFITLAFIFEELLVSQNGFHRIGNNFCLRGRDAQGILVQLTQSINTCGSIREFPKEFRYAATNVAALLKFGSIEFRSLECTVSYKRIMNWIKVLQTLKESARKFKNPKDIISQISLRGPERFIVEQLGLVLAVPYLKVPHHARMIQDGMRLVQEFANSSTWDAMDIKQAEELPKILKKKGQPGEFPLHQQWVQGILNQQVQAGAIPHGGPEGGQNFFGHIIAAPNVDDDEEQQ